MCICEVADDMMHHSISVRIGFKGKGFSAKPVCFHNTCIPLLHGFYQRPEFLVDVWLGVAVAWQEVDESHDRTGLGNTNG